MKIPKLNDSGSMLVIVTILSSLLLIILIGAISLAQLQVKLNLQKVSYAQALHIAEAGVNYYRWVLYHDKEEYCNKEACKPAPDYGPYGPYSYSDDSGRAVGYYVLYITPPKTNGSSIVNVRSVGWTAKHPNVKRTIEVTCGIPSWSTYSNLSNEDIRFGDGTEVWGPIHSNFGVRFDGLAHNTVSSYERTYSDPDHTGANEFAVHTHVSPIDPLPDANNPPQNVPSRPDVFMAGREFPASIVSFDLLNNYIFDIYGMATSSGLVINASNAKGYHLVLSPIAGPGNDSIAVYKVNTVSALCGSENTDKIVSETFLYSTTTPPNGIIYVKDKVWVDGKINNDRLNILAFSDPSTGNTTDIILNKSLLYTNYDGTDALGLIAQRSILIGLYSDDNITIDSALIAKTGRVGRNYFSSSCDSTYYKRSKITVYGSIATSLRYGFAYTDGTGYQTRELKFDEALKFAPPPHFPTTGDYTFISWKEK